MYDAGVVNTETHVTPTGASIAVVLDYIETLIADKAIGPDGRLPTERELAAHTAASRGTVRPRLGSSRPLASSTGTWVVAPSCSQSSTRSLPTSVRQR